MSSLLGVVEYPMPSAQALPRWHCPPLMGLLIVVVAAYGATASSLIYLGFELPVPWGFLPILGFVAFPFGYLIYVGNHWLAARINPRSPLTPLVLPAFGVAVIWSLFGYMQIWIGATVLVFCVVHMALWNRRSLPILAGAILVVFFGCGAVWNLNYLIAYGAGDRLYDPWLMDLDLWCYRSLFGPDVERAGLFPIFRNDYVFLLLERSYHFYFVEFFAVVFVSTGRGKGIARFLAMLFFLYAAGLVVFAVVPTIGPFTFYPDCFSGAYRDTATGFVMGQIVDEYQAVRTHGGLNGFGYFIALPSMHVAKALLIQLWLRGSPCLFWFFLPANILMALSTFLLGYHYIADFPAGIVLTLAVVALWNRLWPVVPPSASVR